MLNKNHQVQISYILLIYPIIQANKNEKKMNFSQIISNFVAQNEISSIKLTDKKKKWQQN